MVLLCGVFVIKGILVGSPNREPTEYSRIYLLGSLYSIVFLLYSWGSPFGVPIRTLLVMASVITERAR